MTDPKSFYIRFEKLSDFIKRNTSEITSAIEDGVKSIQPKNVAVYSSTEVFQQFMTTQKYSILAAIYTHQPSSVYELAKILDRPQQNVARDCEVLAMRKFIKFKTSKTGRKTKKPMLAFDYNKIVVCMPRVTYQISFETAA